MTSSLTFMANVQSCTMVTRGWERHATPAVVRSLICIVMQICNLLVVRTQALALAIHRAPFHLQDKSGSLLSDQLCAAHPTGGKVWMSQEL